MNFVSLVNTDLIIDYRHSDAELGIKEGSIDSQCHCLWSTCDPDPLPSVKRSNIQCPRLPANAGLIVIGFKMYWFVTGVN
jgi:hypothetical protein